jgi:hypothetical protein
MQLPAQIAIAGRMERARYPPVLHDLKETLEPWPAHPFDCWDAFQHSLVVQAKRINTVFLFGCVDMERWLSRRRSQPSRRLAANGLNFLRNRRLSRPRQQSKLRRHHGLAMQRLTIGGRLFSLLHAIVSDN